MLVGILSQQKVRLLMSPEYTWENNPIEYIKSLHEVLGDFDAEIIRGIVLDTYKYGITDDFVKSVIADYLYESPYA